jgi:hypothetical protein
MRRIEVLLPRRCNDPPEQCWWTSSLS